MRRAYSLSEKELFIRLNNLRGLLALVVLFSHIWGYTGLRILVPFNKIVTISVAFFFFLSGYGMTRSYERKQHYLREILYIKIPYLIWMAVLAYIFSAVLEGLLLGGRQTIFLPPGIGRFLISTNWYVYELLGFYLIFVFCKKFVSERYQLLFVALISAAAFVILYYSGLVEAYYNSIIGFWFGMLWGSRGYTEIINKYKKGYIPAVILLLLSFAGMLFLDTTTILFAVIRNLAAVGAIIIVLYCIRYIDPNDKFNRYLSKISPEIYFYHMPIALLLSIVIRNSIIYSLVVISMTMVLSPIFNILNKWIQRNLKRLYNS